VAEAFGKYSGIDLLAGIDDNAAFAEAARNRGVEVAPEDGFDDVFFKVFLRDIEPRLGLTRPLILSEYPRQMAALARLKEDDPRVAERFEVYCGGLELCNAFSELTDAAEQERRLLDESRQRAAIGKTAFVPDRAFLEAVGEMPEAAGVAFGVDRLVMLLTDAPSIRDVLFFPAQELFSAAVEKGREKIIH
jgi:lysyl-tRNA synthetase class 2